MVTRLNWMQSSIVMFIFLFLFVFFVFFFVSDRRYLFGQIWSQNSKLFALIDSNMMIFTFSVFDQKYAFWVNLVQKSKLSVKAKIWCLHKFEYAKLNVCSQSFCLSSEMSFLSKFGPRNQNYQFEVKCGT